MSISTVVEDMKVSLEEGSLLEVDNLVAEQDSLAIGLDSLAAGLDSLAAGLDSLAVELDSLAEQASGLDRALAGVALDILVVHMALFRERAVPGKLVVAGSDAPRESRLPPRELPPFPHVHCDRCRHHHGLPCQNF
jgi:hypothetical protein